MLRTLLRTKELVQPPASDGQGLHKTLTVWHLAAIGIGCMVGVGIFVLPGVEAAQHAGPGITLSFMLAALAVGFAALAYAELSAMLPISGGAYSYCYMTLGEFPAWLTGWTLLFEYAVAAAMVAIGWSAYLGHLLQGFGIGIPQTLMMSPFGAQSGMINLPALLVVLITVMFALLGIQESARAALALVVVKLAAVLIFLGESVGHVRTENWIPFMPFGFSGVLTAASVTFIAFGGFEAMTTAAEEARNPQRDLPRALGITLLVVMLAYVAVAAVMTGVMSYQELDVADPMTVVLVAAQHPWAAQLIAAAALFGMTSVLLALFVALPRIIFAMARDGLLPDALAKLHHRFGTPQRATLAVGLLVAVIASLLPIQVVAELCSLGILTASLIVCLAVLVLRYSHPDLPRPFRMPAAFLLAPLGILIYLTLIFMLPAATLLRYLIWLGLGTLLWVCYGRRTSHLVCRKEQLP